MKSSSIGKVETFKYRSTAERQGDYTVKFSQPQKCVPHPHCHPSLPGCFPTNVPWAGSILRLEGKVLLSGSTSVKWPGLLRHGCPKHGSSLQLPMQQSSPCDPLPAKHKSTDQSYHPNGFSHQLETIWKASCPSNSWWEGWPRVPQLSSSPPQW